MTVHQIRKAPKPFAGRPAMFYVGTSGWAYAAWKPKFYSADLPQTRFLRFYSARLNAVEVNYTFCGRHSLRQSVAERWLAQTPDDFVFAFRGPKPISHFYRHRLRNAKSLVSRFEMALAPFRRAGRLGPVLFQLPHTFSTDAGVLEEFLHRWPRGLRVSFEFRNPSWFNDQVYDILHRYAVALCWAERDDMRTPEVVTAPFLYLRLRRSKYSRTTLHRIIERIEYYAHRGDVCAFFRQDEAENALYATQVLRALCSRNNASARVLPTTPSPDNESRCIYKRH